MGYSDCSFGDGSLPFVDAGGKERRGKPCLGMFDIRFVVRVSSSWSLQCGDMFRV